LSKFSTLDSRPSHRIGFEQPESSQLEDTDDARGAWPESEATRILPTLLGRNRGRAPELLKAAVVLRAERVHHQPHPNYARFLL
jgi:hypothetical protein